MSCWPPRGVSRGLSLAKQTELSWERNPQRHHRAPLRLSPGRCGSWENRGAWDSIKNRDVVQTLLCQPAQRQRGQGVRSLHGRPRVPAGPGRVSAGRAAGRGRPGPRRRLRGGQSPASPRGQQPCAPSPSGQCGRRRRPVRERADGVRRVVDRVCRPGTAGATPAARSPCTCEPEADADADATRRLGRSRAGGRPGPQPPAPSAVPVPDGRCAIRDSE